jgi:hypothetical protein
MNILDKKYKEKSGIYKIVNLINNKVYIGSSVDLRKRSIHHRSHLKNGSSHCKYLQYAVNKYGIENFRIEIIKVVDDISLMREFEEYYINFFNSVVNGYNSHNMVIANNYLAESSKVPILCYDLDGNFIREFESIVETSRITGHSNVGIFDVCKEKVGKCGNYIFRYKKNSDYPLKINKYIHGNKGIKRSKEWNEKIRQRKLGTLQSEETKKKRSEVMTGRKMTKKQLDVGYNNISKYIKPKRKVVQIDMISGEIINIFESMKDAADFFKRPAAPSSICEVCKGTMKSYLGYKWKYFENVELVN